MNSPVNANVVHESEAQRQHARVKIPAKLRFFNTDRTQTEARVIDLSAGGLAFTATQPLTVGEVHKGRLQFVIDNLGLAMDVELQIRSYDRQTGRAGCQFQNLEQQDISTLPLSLILRALVKLSRCRVASTSPIDTMSPDKCEVIRWRRVEISCCSRFWNWQPARPVWRS